MTIVGIVIAGLLFTVPLLFTSATVVFEDDHAPPPEASDKERVLPAHTEFPPIIEFGRDITLTVSFVMQPPDATEYVNTEVPKAAA